MSKQLEKILNSFSKNKIINFSNLNDVVLDLQNSEVGQICFYRITDINLFYQRLKSAKCSLLVTDIEVDKNIKNHIVVGKDLFFKIQEQIMEILFPSKNILKFIGVTGTNGKTTVSELAAQIANLSGIPSISVGTIGVKGPDGKYSSSHGTTSPSFIDLMKIIHHWQNKVEYVFIELSSHALEQKRFSNLLFEHVAMTSFSQDHLDYHQTMESYLGAKLKILEIQKDITKGILIAENSGLELVLPLDIINKAKTLKGRGLIEIPAHFQVAYNKRNLELALELVSLIGGSVKGINLSKLKVPKGRFQIVKYLKGIVIIDFAHTPDALENICSEIKNLYKNKKLITIFGCGGNRDRNKRSLMGQAVATYSDRVIVTSDNPRDEDPDRIINDTVKDLDKNKYEREVDRKIAIENCLKDLSDNDILLIAGKGHEEYQEIMGVKYPFSDFNIVKTFGSLHG